MTPRPNIVLLTLDAWRADGLGLSPDLHVLERLGLREHLATPNLDSFARDSLYFPNAFAPAPYTTASHASILTGLYPPQTGVRAFFKHRLPADIETLPQLLAASGYATLAMIETEEARGQFFNDMLRSSGVDVLRGIGEVIHTEQELASTRAVASGQPVFAFLHVWDLHFPYLWSCNPGLREMMRGHQPLVEFLRELQQRGLTVPDPDRPTVASLYKLLHSLMRQLPDVEARARLLFEWYLRGISWFDRNRWPRIVASLKEAGLWEDTLLFVYGDHGEGLHLDSLGSGLYGFDHSQTVHDDELRVPLLLHGLPAAINTEAVSLVDIFPTALAAAGVDTPLKPERPGVNLAPFAGVETPGWDTKSAGSRLSARNDNPIHRVSESQPGDSSPGLPRPLFAETWTRIGKVAPPSNAEAALPTFDRGLLMQNLPQFTLYQRMARVPGWKLLSHDGPVKLRRYLRGPLILHRLLDRLGQVVGRQGRQPLRTGDRPWSPSPHLFYFNLTSDPDEMHPRRYSPSAPPEVHQLRAALEDLYRDARFGDEIQLESLDEQLVAERLTQLGYLE